MIADCLHTDLSVYYYKQCIAFVLLILAEDPGCYRAPSPESRANAEEVSVLVCWASQKCCWPWITIISANWNQIWPAVTPTYAYPVSMGSFPWKPTRIGFFLHYNNIWIGTWVYAVYSPDLCNGMYVVKINNLFFIQTFKITQ